MRFYDLKTALARPAEATELFLNSKGWTEVPVEVWTLEYLEVLDLSDNALIEIPAALGQLQQLKSLNLSLNQLKKLPAALGLLTRLQKLNLSANRFAFVPAGIKQLSALKELMLGQNQLKTLVFTSSFPQLQLLNVEKNKIQALHWAGDFFPALSRLELAHNKITAFTLEQPLVELRYLNVANNKLTQLPSPLIHSIYLQSLIANKNAISELPQNLSQWTWLRSLNLANNLLSVLPPSIAACLRLEEADFSHNQLGGLPLLPVSIRQLNLNENAFALFPAAILTLNELRELQLANNPLEELPQALSELTRLKKISLSGTANAALLLSLDHVTQLKVWQNAEARKNLLQIIKVGANNKLTVAARLAFFKVLQTADLQYLHELSLEELLVGCKSGHWQLRGYILQHLKDEQGASFTDLVPFRDVIAILGKTVLSHKVWKTRLDAQKISLTFQLSAQITHIVLGAGPFPAGVVQFDEHRPLIWLEEPQLLQWMEQKEALHLVVEGKEQQLQSLKRLLLHADPVNVAIAAQTMLQGGVPQTILPYLLIAYKWLPTSESVRKTLHHLLLSHWPSPFAMTNRKKIPLSRSQAPEVFHKNLEKLLEGSGMVAPEMEHLSWIKGS
jgi:Leucine-rich repeat (LRR) protein